ncbi:hypothetical protein [Hyphobacterium sp.]|uniref:hypothetical protein n=1 Tax=Hyphobacterium sp. TaxID=2004662 RepID=UPI003B5244BD
MRAAFLSTSMLLVLTACSAPEDADTEIAQGEAPVEEAAETETPAASEDEAAAVGLPANDIALADIAWTDGLPQLGEFAIVTSAGSYDNQPAFDAAGGFYFTTESPGANTDIHYRGPGGEIRPITRTPDESEYSPRPSPNGASVTYIHQPPGQVGGQAWRHQLEGGNAEPIHPYGPAGYYALSGDQRQLVLFALTDPFTLLWFDIESGEQAEIATGIGRALYTSPDGTAAYFTLPQSDDSWTVNRVDFANRSVIELFSLPGQAQDYAVFTTPQGETGWFSASDGTLMFRLGDAGEWSAVASLQALGEGEVTRLAVSPNADRLALVVAETD